MGNITRSLGHPVDAYLQDKTAAQGQRKQKELDLWKAWKESDEHPDKLAPLLKLYDPVFAQKMRQWRAPTVPEAAFKAELQTHAIKAFQSYDPSRGAALNTHVENRLQKAKRYNNRTQNMAYIPEGQAGHIGPINKAKDELKEELGRDPTHSEIADHLGMQPARVEKIMGAMKRDVPASRAAGPDSYDYSAGTSEPSHMFEEQQIAVAQNILPNIFPNNPAMHSLFHYTFGTNDHPKVTSTSELAQRMGKSQSQISRMKTQLGNTLKKHMGLSDDD